MFHTAEPVMKWHQAHEAYLTKRRPVASVGVLWSQRNTDFYGRDAAADLVDAPYNGFVQALIRARIPYIPVHAGQIESDAPQLSVLILPNVGGLSDEHCAAIRRFVERGGSLIATGDSTLYNEWGDPRPDFALADLLRVHLEEKPVRRRTAGSVHTYLRLHPKFQAQGSGRHPVLSGFDETDIIPFGGTLQPLRTDADVVVALTLIPEFPVYPPETAWMRETDSKIPGLVVSSHAKGGRIAYLAADLDRRYFRELQPDHGNLLANLVRWTAGDSIPLQVEGHGLIDCHVYQQETRTIVHLVNLTSAGTWRAPMDELIAVGPLKVRVKRPGRRARFLVSAGSTAVNRGEFEVKSVLDHEVVVIE